MYGLAGLLSATSEENSEESCSVTVSYTKDRFVGACFVLFYSFKLYS